MKKKSTGKVINIIMMFFLLLSTFAMIIHRAYLNGCYISPDSSNYLLEAKALLAGNGLWFNREAGLNGFFSTFPIGYPALIALCAQLLGLEVYLASKILSLFFLLVICIVIYKYFGEDTWLFLLFFLNIGFNNIFYYTWSEQMFIVTLIWFTCVISKILQTKEVSKKNGVTLIFLSIAMFLSRYIGGISVIMIGCIILLWIIKREDKKMIYRLISINIINVIVMFGYLANNYIACGTPTGIRPKATISFMQFIRELKDALLIEMKNMLGYFMQIENTVAVVLWIVTLIFLASRLKRNVKKYVTSASFIAVACIYLGCFLFMKYTSTMDPISGRFLLPATILIFIAFVNAIKENMSDKGRIALACCILFLGGMNYLYPAMRGIVNTKGRDHGYVAQMETWKKRLDDVPAKAIVLWAFDSELENNMVKYIRNDIWFEYPEELIDPETLQRLHADRTVWVDIDGLYAYAKLRGWEIEDVKKKFSMDRYAGGLVKIDE